MEDNKELVRYRPAVYMEPCLGGMFNDEFGEYVRHDQAAEMIAAKDEKVQELKEKIGVVSTERHADAEYIGHLQAELAKINDQKPVAYTYNTPLNKTMMLVEYKPSDGNDHWYLNLRPVFAAPIDQTAEIEMLRDAAKKVISRWESPHWKVTAPTEDVMNELRDVISGKVPE